MVSDGGPGEDQWMNNIIYNMKDEHTRWLQRKPIKRSWFTDPLKMTNTRIPSWLSAEEWSISSLAEKSSSAHTLAQAQPKHLSKYLCDCPLWLHQRKWADKHHIVPCSTKMLVPFHCLLGNSFVSDHKVIESARECWDWDFDIPRGMKLVLDSSKNRAGSASKMDSI
jgi:hypothetical protein